MKCAGALNEHFTLIVLAKPFWHVLCDNNLALNKNLVLLNITINSIQSDRIIAMANVGTSLRIHIEEHLTWINYINQVCK